MNASTPGRFEARALDAVEICREVRIFSQRNDQQLVVEHLWLVRVRVLDALAQPRGQITTSEVDNQLGWDGYVFNAETAHYHVRFRCYSPELGRWLARDPVEEVGGLNLYGFVENDPVASWDKLGLVRVYYDS